MAALKCQTQKAKSQARNRLTTAELELHPKQPSALLLANAHSPSQPLALGVGTNTQFSSLVNYSAHFLSCTFISGQT